MKVEIEKGNVRLSQEHGRIKVDMVDEILFDVGDSSISRSRVWRCSPAWARSSPG